MSETAEARAGGSGDRRGLGPETWIWCGATLAVAIAFGWLGSLGWPGEPSGCLTRFVCFCEAVQSGVARQPWNTWSNLPAIALAGWVSWQVSAIRGDAARQADERLMRVAGVGGVFVAMLWFQGVGSLFFHGALTHWSAVLDALSVFFVAGVLLVTNLLRLGWLRWGDYWKALLTVLGLGLLYRLYVIPMTAPAVLVLGIGVAATEVACARKRRREGAIRGESRWFRYGLWVFVLGVLAFAMSLTTGMPLCSEEVGIPGHALWHVTSAVASYFFWLNARVQLSVPAAAEIAGR
jgi:hypothetical protein